MKKLCLISFMAVFCYNSFAASVDSTTAKIVAVNFMHYRSDNQRNIPLSQATIHHIRVLNDSILFYIINFNSGGFVIVSADERVQPILGYSLNSTFNLSQEPPALNYLLNIYADQIICLKAENNNRSSHNLFWEVLKSGSKIVLSRNYVEPLLWNYELDDDYEYGQDDPFNLLTPTHPSTPNTHPLTGCVATAMAQIMRYWECPLRGTGQNTYVDPASTSCNPDDPSYGTVTANFANSNYDWNIMPTSNPSSWTSQQDMAVALLLRDCGISVDMDYSVCASSASSSDIPYALENYFFYAPTADYKDRSWHPTNWNTLLQNELNEDRPVEYRGTGSGGGHAWVLDGYDDLYVGGNGTGLYYHMNWGWTGSCNDYYTLDDLSPECISGSLNNDQGGVFGIQPSFSYPSVNISNPANYSTVSGTVQIDATASDGIGVYRVDFYIDNTFLSSDLTSPYSAQWNTTNTSNGSHFVIAKAFNNANNYTTANVSVTVSNTTPSGPNLALANTANIPDPVSYGGGTYTIAVTNTGTGTLSWNTQYVPSWVTLNPASNSNTTTSTTVNVTIQSNSGSSPRSCGIMFYNTNNSSDYEYLNIFQSATPPATNDWESFHKDMQNTGYLNVSINTSIGQEWMQNAPININVNRGPLIVGNKVIFTSSNGIFCTDLAGITLWSNSTISSSTFPAVYNNVLFVGDDDDDKVYAYDISNGNLLDDHNIFNPNGTIKADGSGVYVPTDAGRLYCLTFSSNTFSTKWYFDANSTYSDQFKFKGSGAIVSDYVYANVINNSENKYYLVKLNKTTGAKVTEFLVNGSSMYYCNTPVLYNSYLFLTYVTGSTAKMACVNSSTMYVAWYCNFLNNDYISSPVMYNNRLYVSDDAGYVYSINATNASPTWYFQEDYGSEVEGLAVVNNALIVVSQSEVNLVNLTTGDEITTRSIPSGDYSPPAIAGNKIIFGNTDEEIYCFSNTYPPNADFDATPTSGTAPLTVNFDNDSDPGSTPITGYSWDFGDGGTSTSTAPSHVYTNTGQYTVSLTVNSSSGSDTKVRTNYISVTTPPYLIIIPPDYEFGNVLTGSCSADHAFIINNTGGGTATGNISLSNTADFQFVSGGGSFSIPAGSSINVIVKFCPATAGDKICLLNVDAAEPCNDISSSLTGLGIAPYIVVTSPEGGEIWQPGQVYSIAWNDNIPENVRIELHNTAGLNLMITSSTESDGEYSWQVPANQTLASDYKIKIISTINASLYDYSENNFTVGYPPPTITVNPASLEFGEVTVGTTSSPQQYDAAGENLTSPILITSPAFCQISLSSSTGYTNSINLNPSGGTVSNTTIYVVFNPTEVTEYTGNITNTSSGASSQNVSAHGWGVPQPIPEIFVNPSFLSFGEVPANTTSTAQTYAVSGQNLTSNVTINTPAGFEVSLSSTSGFMSSLTLVPTNGTVAMTTIYVRFAPSQGVNYNGNITNASTGAVTQNVNVTGTGIQSILSVTPLEQEIDYEGGVVYFSVANTGNGTMNYSAQVTSGNTWLQIISGSTGINSGTIEVNVGINSTSSVREGNITVTATGALNSPQIVTVVQNPDQTAVLLVEPPFQNIGHEACTTSFNVTNTGGGSMNFSSQVTYGAEWLSILSGGSGINQGTIVLFAEDNFENDTRTGVLTVTAPSSSNYSMGVIVNQSGVIGVLDLTFDKLSVYPNPVEDQIFIKCNESVSILKVKLLNSVNMQLYPVVEKKDVSRDDIIALDYPNIAAGVYFLIIEADGNILSRKIIKIHGH